MAFQELVESTISTVADLAVVAPAGTDGMADPLFPGTTSGRVQAGALDRAFQMPAGFSSCGDPVDVWAPGEDLVTAFPHGWRHSEEPGRVAGPPLLRHGPVERYVVLRGARRRA